MITDWRYIGYRIARNVNGVVVLDPSRPVTMVVNYAASGVPFSQVLLMLVGAGGVARG